MIRGRRQRRRVLRRRHAKRRRIRRRCIHCSRCSSRGHLNLLRHTLSLSLSLSLPDDSASPPPGLAPSTPTSVLAPSAPTQPRPVTLTPPLSCPSILAPDPPLSPAPPTSVSFGPGILEALPYADLPQEPYPPPDITKADELASIARNTADEIRHEASLQVFITSKQRSTLGPLPEAVTHPAATFLQSYVEEGMPATTGPPWSRTDLDEAIRNRRSGTFFPDLRSGSFSPNPLEATATSPSRRCGCRTQGGAERMKAKFINQF